MIILIVPWLAAAIPSLISGAGNIFGSMISRGQSRRDVQAQNLYNNPVNQLARLREAGLPYAAFANNQAGTQSSLPTTSGEGVGEAGNKLGEHINTQLQLKQLKLLDEQIKTQEWETQKKGQEWAALVRQGNYEDMDMDNNTPISAGARKYTAEVKAAEAHKLIQENHAEMSRIDAEVKRDLHNTGTLSTTTRKHLEILINQLDLGKQAFRRGTIMDVLISQLQKGGVTTAEAFLHSVMSGGFGIGSIVKPH